MPEPAGPDRAVTEAKLNEAMNPRAQMIAPAGKARRMNFPDDLIEAPKVKNSAHTMNDTQSGMLNLPRNIVRGRNTMAVMPTASQNGIVSFVLISAIYHSSLLVLQPWAGR